MIARTLIFASVLLFTLPLHANDTIPLSITVSGGVSLGSYQAGYHYVSQDWLRVNRSRCKVYVVTGASAGAINALLTVLTLADTGFVRDTESVFYRSWVPVGYEALKGGKSPLGVFQRGFFDTLKKRVIAPKLANTSPGPDLDVILGITATLVLPERIGFKNTMTLPSAEDKFIVRMRKKPNGGWELSNYIDTTLKRPVPVLPLRIGNDLDVMAGIIYASSGFPGAFPPLPVSQKRIVPFAVADRGLHWDAGSVPLWSELSGFDSLSPSYIDGGTFDNAPMRMACTIVCNGLVQGETRQWNPVMSWQSENPLVDSMQFSYLSQNNTTFPQKKFRPKDISGSLAEYLVNFGSNFIACSRTKELTSLADRFPDFDERLSLTNSYSPTMSEYLFSFCGFFEKRFRIFDFYLGMYDAQRYLGSVTTPNLNRKVGTRGRFTNTLPCIEPINADCRFLLTQKTLDAIYSCVAACQTDTAFSQKKQDSLLKPVTQWYDSVAKIATCGSEEFRQHAILLQTSVDRLWSRWVAALRDSSVWQLDTAKLRSWGVFVGKSQHPTFFHLPVIGKDDFEKNVVQQVMSGANDGRIQLGEPEFDALLYLLDYYNYYYTDVLSGRANTRKAKVAIADKFRALLTVCGDNQNSVTEKLIYKMAAKPVTNLFAYSPPTTLIRLTGGFTGVELGGILRPFRLPVLDRFGFDLFMHFNKGSKFNKGYAENSIRQWYPNLCMGFGGIFDILEWKSVFQLKYGINCTMGKDWLINYPDRYHFTKDWAVGFYPIVLQGSLMDLLIIRFNYGSQRRLLLDNPEEDAKWDWTRIDLQVGAQLIW